MAKNKIRVVDRSESLKKKFVLLSNFMDLYGAKPIADDLIVLSMDPLLKQSGNKELAQQTLQLLRDMRNNLDVEASNLEYEYGISLKRSCHESEEVIRKEVGQSLLNTYDTICENLEFLDELDSLIQLAGVTIAE